MKKESNVTIYDAGAIAKKTYEGKAPASYDPKDLIKRITEIKSFDDSIALVNEMAGLGRMQWTVTAMAVYKGCSFTKSQKEAREMLKKYAGKMGYSESQAYNFRKAGNMLLKGLTDGTIKSFESLPASLHEFLGQYKKEKDPLKSQFFEMKIENTIASNDESKFFLVSLVDIDNEERKGYAMLALSKEVEKGVQINVKNECLFLACKPYTLENAKGNTVEAYATEVEIVTNGDVENARYYPCEVAKMPLMN